jgi:hypothetical protein
MWLNVKSFEEPHWRAAATIHIVAPQGRLAEGNNFSIFAREVDDRITGPIYNGFCVTAMFV